MTASLSLSLFVSLALALAAPLSGCSGPNASLKPTAAERLNGEGVRRLERGDADAAEETFRDALEEAALVDDLKGQAEAWNNLGALAMARGKPAEAVGCHETAIELHRARGVRDAGEVRARANLGAALLALGKLSAAEAELKAAVSLAIDLGEPSAALLAKTGLASVALHNKDAARAAALAREAAAEAARANSSSALASALAVEGAALAALGDLAAARARFEDALAIDRRREAPHAVAADLRALAAVAERQGDLAAASSYLARSARIARWTGDLATAERELERALRLARRASSKDIELIEGELSALKRAVSDLPARPPPARDAEPPPPAP
jgi:tetratricopeptide (TPR) repeat protein